MLPLSESLHKYLTATATDCSRDLVNRWSIDMETQVNVAADKGTPVDGKRSTYDDGQDIYWNIRIPKGAADEPEFKDYPMSWPLDPHVEGIGLTGWNWKEKRSCWVGFDFDSLTTHAKGVGISEEELEKVKSAASAIPWVEVRKSTGGNGLHLYVYLDVPTNNHTEHAALARAVLGLLSESANFDFASQVDCCGAILWIWHRKLKGEGLKILKAAEHPLMDVPANWRDHIEVVTRKRAKVKVKGIDDTSLDKLSASRQIVPLDATHKKTIDLLMATGYSTVWVSDYHLLQTHTKALEEIQDEVLFPTSCQFKTISEGNNKATCNCFAFPLPNGAWRVFRFSQGTHEAETWTQDGNGWTCCYYNRPADLRTASVLSGCVRGMHEEQLGTVKQISQALDKLGYSLSLGEEFQARNASIKKDKNLLVVQFSAEPTDKTPSGFARTKKQFVQVIEYREPECELAPEHDTYIRYLHPDGVWYVLANDWIQTSQSAARCVLLQHEYNRDDADSALGYCIQHPWQRVCLPFMAEYPGGRQWNLNSPQLKMVPLPGEHPAWNLVLTHFFAELTEHFKTLPDEHPWKGKTGLDYGILYVASLVRNPLSPLPYIFAYGPENCGKSAFPDAMGKHIMSGVARADKFFEDGNNFNGELENAVLCVIEETDFSKHKNAHVKIKSAVTSSTQSIRRMRTDRYEVPNSWHWIHTANEPQACPIFPGDTRILMLRVPELSKEIPQAELDTMLAEEAPHFLQSLLHCEIPKPDGRLGLPVFDTASKQTQLDRGDYVAKFVDECCVLTGSIFKSRLLECFDTWCDRNNFVQLAPKVFTQMLKAKHKMVNNTHKIGNKPAYTGISLKQFDA